MFDRAIHVLRKFGRTLLQALTVVVIRWLDTNKMVGSVAKEKTSRFVSSSKTPVAMGIHGKCAPWRKCS
jgi:hypothetical protein